MLSIVDHGPVRELVMTSPVARAVRYRAGAFHYRGFLIDSGISRARRDLAAYLAANRPAGAVITHWHEDHAGNLGLLVERGIPVTVSSDTLAWQRSHRRVPLYRWASWGNPLLPRSEPQPADHPFELIPTPGHTPDHLAVWDPDGGVLFTGDLFLGIKAAVAHHEYEAPWDTLESVRRVLALRPKAMFDAHRGPVRDPATALALKADWLDKTMAAVRAAIDAGQTDDRIVRDLLGGEDAVARGSRGEMSKANFVRALRRGPEG